jgi:hypothetical protein
VGELRDETMGMRFRKMRRVVGTLENGGGCGLPSGPLWCGGQRGRPQQQRGRAEKGKGRIRKVDVNGKAAKVWRVTEGRNSFSDGESNMPVERDARENPELWEFLQPSLRLLPSLRLSTASLPPFALGSLSRGSSVLQDG